MYSNKKKLEKIGNALIFLSERIPEFNKTKALKVLYLLDELSVKKRGIPIFGLDYQVWKYGPVSPEVYFELSEDNSILFKDYIKLEKGEDNTTYIKPAKKFDDGEFSQWEVNLMNSFVDQIKSKTAKQLIDFTHKEDSLWYKKAEEHNVLNELLNEQINTTKIEIDLSQAADEDWKKAAYHEYKEIFG
jgi:uncharacterized phage-associated protein